MNEEVGSGNLPSAFCLQTSSLSRSFDDRDEDGGQFVALGSQGLQLVRWDNFSIDKQFQPVGGFFQFAQGVAAFCDELGFASSAMRFAVVRPDGGSRAQELFAQHVSFRGFRQASEQANDAQGKLLGAVFEVVFFLHNSDFARLKYEGGRMNDEVGIGLLHSAF